MVQKGFKTDEPYVTRERQNLKYCQPLTNLKKTQKSTGGRVYGF